MDLSRVMPVARPIVVRAAEIYMRHMQPWLIGLILHGSALKGDPIPGCSDIDMQLYLSDAAFSENNSLPLALCIAIHRELSTIPLAPFREIQCFAFRNTIREDWLGPPPGSYLVLAGRLPIPETSAEQLVELVHTKLRTIQLPVWYADALLQVGPGELDKRVRRLCPEVWPVARHLLTLQTADPIRVWNMPRRILVEAIPASKETGRLLREFEAALLRYYPEASSTEDGLQAVQAGFAFLEAACREE